MGASFETSARKSDTSGVSAGCREARWVAETEVAPLTGLSGVLQGIPADLEEGVAPLLLVLLSTAENTQWRQVKSIVVMVEDEGSYTKTRVHSSDAT